MKNSLQILRIQKTSDPPEAGFRVEIIGDHDKNQKLFVIARFLSFPTLDTALVLPYLEGVVLNRFPTGRCLAAPNTHLDVEVSRGLKPKVGCSQELSIFRRELRVTVSTLVKAWFVACVHRFCHTNRMFLNILTII